MLDGQELHKDSRVRVAPTNSKSLEVQEVLGSGAVVCATAVDKLKILSIKNVINFVE